MNTSHMNEPATTLAPAPERHTGNVVSDTLVIAKRNLLRILRTPQLIVFNSIQPIMFTLLFRYVFGGSIPLPPPWKYVDYLIPGIIVQTTLFGGAGTAIAMAEDIKQGIIDRFRSLPMSRGAVLAGRTIADLVRLLFVIVLLVIVGSAVGFRFHNGFLPGLLAIALCILFGFAFLWFFAFMGMAAKDTETAQLMSFLPIFPLTFASSIFTRIQTMPGWLQVFARNQPVTKAVNAVRALTQGHDRMLKIGYPEATGTLVIQAVIWCVVIATVFATLAINRYRKG
jgi:ABC transporter DrrB family efflux protein